MDANQSPTPPKDLLLQWQAELGYCIGSVEDLSYITTRAIVWDRARRDPDHVEVLSEDDSWITDRLPTEADADKDGNVAMRTHPSGNRRLVDADLCHNRIGLAWRNMQVFIHWSQVGPGISWMHTTHWEPPAQRDPDHVEVLSEDDSWITDRLPTEADAESRRGTAAERLAKVALTLLDDISISIDAAHYNTIRRALERLQQLEQQP